MMQETMEPKMSAEYVAKCNQLKRLKLGNTECIKWVSYSQVRQALDPQDAHANAFWRATLSVFLLLQVIFASWFQITSFKKVAGGARSDVGSHNLI